MIPMGPGRRFYLAAPLFVALFAGSPGCSGKGEAPCPVAGEGHGAPGTSLPAAGAGTRGTPSSPTAAQPVRILLWHAYRAGEKEALDQVVKAFNDRRRDILLETLAVPYDALADKVTAAVPRGHGPDLFIFAHNRAGDWADLGVVEPIGYWVEDALLDLYFEETVKALVYKGSLYGLPLAFKCLALFYNKDLVKEPPATLDDLLAQARRLTDPRKGVYGLAYESTKLYFAAPFLHAFGARVLDEKGDLAVEGPAAEEAVRFLARLGRERVMPDEVTTFLVTSLFNQGKAAMVVNGPWFLTEIEPGVSYGVAPLPRRGDRPAAPFLGSEAVMMSARSAHKGEAFEVMRFLTSDEAARIRARVGRQMVANRAIYSDPEVAADPVIAAFRKQLETTVPMDNTPRMQLVWSTMDTALFRAVKGGEDPARVLEEAAQKIRLDWERAGK